MRAGPNHPQQIDLFLSIFSIVNAHFHEYTAQPTAQLIKVCKVNTYLNILLLFNTSKFSVEECSIRNNITILPIQNWTPFQGASSGAVSSLSHLVVELGVGQPNNPVLVDGEGGSRWHEGRGRSHVNDLPREGRRIAFVVRVGDVETKH